MATNTETLHSPSIALFLPTLTPGGIERCMVNLAEGFIDREIEVDLVVADRRGSFEAKVPAGTTIVDLNAGRVLKSIVPLVKYLRERNPDVLLSGHTHANLVAIWSGKISRTRTDVVIGVHNPHSKNYHKNKKLKSQLVGKLFPVTYEFADEIIAVSEGIAEDLVEISRLNRDQVSVIYNPVVGRELYNLAKETASHPWLENKEITVIMCAGRLSTEKDFGTLIRAFQLVHDRNPNTRLIIAGDGKEREKLETLATDSNISKVINFTGHLENPYKFMRESDLFVVSSKWEGFGIVLVEAMAVGTPVISTNCPTGPAEILDDGAYGQLVPVGDVETMANSIEENLYADNDSRKIKSRAEDFSVPSVVDEYIKTLQL